MAEPIRFSPEQLSILMRVAAGKLGKDPVKLTDDLKSGQFDGVLESLGADRQKVAALLSDKDALAKLLQSNEVRNMLQQFLGGQQ